MPVAVTSIPGAFAGEVSGIDCAAALTQADVRAVEAAMERHAVIVSHDQKLTDEQQIAFTKSFGELERYETPGHIRKREEERLGRGIADFSNLTRDGAIMAPEDRIWLFKLADRLWHSDSSYRPVPAKWSLLSGRTIPPRGGETELADMRAAYDALDDEMKAEIEDLVCEHSLIYSREAIGFTELTPEEREHFRPVRHRLVRIDPKTGRKSLFLSAHAGAIVGWTLPEARMLLRDLVEHATQPRFVYRHRWRAGDLVVWDNRTTMHRARRFDRKDVRDVRRTTLAGDPVEAHPVSA
ncbi:MAG TPA: TauD/TfdA family dioxygenase [Roseiarcus sp.]|nr:TauD/TfdA family dioxygenase [Roseiarcus sp.]